jgi:hypothetical protein
MADCTRRQLLGLLLPAALMALLLLLLLPLPAVLWALLLLLA